MASCYFGASGAAKPGGAQSSYFGVGGSGGGQSAAKAAPAQGIPGQSAYFSVGGTGTAPGTVSAYFSPTSPGAMGGGGAPAGGASQLGAPAAPMGGGSAMGAPAGGSSTMTAVGHPMGGGGGASTMTAVGHPMGGGGGSSTMTAVGAPMGGGGGSSTMTAVGAPMGGGGGSSTMTAVGAPMGGGGGASTMTAVGAPMGGGGASTMTAVGAPSARGASTMTAVGAPMGGGGGASTMTAVGAPMGGGGGASTMTAVGAPMGGGGGASTMTAVGAPMGGGGTSTMTAVGAPSARGASTMTAVGAPMGGGGGASTMTAVGGAGGGSQMMGGGAAPAPSSGGPAACGTTSGYFGVGGGGGAGAQSAYFGVGGAGGGASAAKAAPAAGIPGQSAYFGVSGGGAGGAQSAYFAPNSFNWVVLVCFVQQTKLDWGRVDVKVTLVSALLAGRCVVVAPRVRHSVARDCHRHVSDATPRGLFERSTERTKTRRKEGNQLRAVGETPQSVLYGFVASGDASDGFCVLLVSLEFPLPVSRSGPSVNPVVFMHVTRRFADSVHDASSSALLRPSVFGHSSVVGRGLQSASKQGKNVLNVPMVDGDDKPSKMTAKLQKSHTYSKARSPGGALLAMRRGSFVQLFGSSGLLTNSQGGSNPLLAAPSTSQVSLYSSGSGSFVVTPAPTNQELTRVLFRVDSENDENNERSSSDASSTAAAEVSESLYPTAVKELEQLGLHRAGGPGAPTGIFNVLTSSNASSSGVMRRVMRVIVAGSKRVGKTACLQQLARYTDVTGQPYSPTIDDTYQVQIEYSDRPKEVIVFHDTAGISDYGPIELRRPYIQVADAFILVYAVNDHESFNRMDLLKKYIDKQFGKDKKEVPIIVLGNKTDQSGRKVDFDFATSWAAKERVRLFEVTATDRNSLLEPINHLSSRYFHPPKESKFSLSKKLKPEKSNTAIVMDF